MLGEKFIDLNFLNTAVELSRLAKSEAARP